MDCASDTGLYIKYDEEMADVENPCERLIRYSRDFRGYLMSAKVGFGRERRLSRSRWASLSELAIYFEG
jgi:hypothetical protein